MKTLLLLLFILISCSGLQAQDSTIVTINAGSNIKDVLKPTDIFYYPQFTSGKVFFRNGTKTTASMNYSRLSDQMLFINPKGDTLALADEKLIKFIAIDQDTFYFDEGYIRLIRDNGVVKLAEKQIWVFADVRRMGSHNRSTNTVAITTISTLSSTGRAKSHDFLINEDVLIRKEVQYYFGNTYNLFARASKKKLLLLFPKEQLGLENYLQENKVNFDKKEDLEKLAQFLAQSH